MLLWSQKQEEKRLRPIVSGAFHSNRSVRSPRSVYVCVSLVKRSWEWPDSLWAPSLLTGDQLTQHKARYCFLDDNPAFTFWKRDHTLLSVIIESIFSKCNSRRNINICLLCESSRFLLLWCRFVSKGPVYGEEMTRSRVDRPGVRQLNAPCCSG